MILMTSEICLYIQLIHVYKLIILTHSFPVHSIFGNNYTGFIIINRKRTGGGSCTYQNRRCRRRRSPGYRDSSANPRCSDKSAHTLRCLSRTRSCLKKPYAYMQWNIVMQLFTNHACIFVLYDWDRIMIGK